MTPANVGPMFDSLNYEAPFLIEKLLKEQIAETPDEAEALFTEIKRYIVLVHVDNTIAWKMYSLRVDEVWHQFVLFTSEYIDYCQRFFNRYIQHNPSNSPEATIEHVENAPSSFAGFRNRYELLFEQSLPEVWYDEKSVKPQRRVINYDAGKWTLRGMEGTVDLVDGKGDILLSVNGFAHDALAFVANTGAFYVRELPGGLTDEEKVGLIATLVEYKLLRVAP